MGVPVTSFDDFTKKLNRFQKGSPVFGFLVYDGRPSQRAVRKFAQRESTWIDDLARGAEIYFFYPHMRDKTKFKNPSREIMNLFNLRSSRLPGIIFFAPPRVDGSVRTEHAVYVPLASADFGEPSVYEPILDELFGMVRASVENAGTSHGALVAIHSHLGRLRRRRGWRGVADRLRKGARLVLFQAPAAVWAPVGEGIGKALGSGITGSIG